MFEELFPGPIALARHRTSPFADERRQFLRHLHDLGYARLSLKAVGCELVVISYRPKAVTNHRSRVNRTALASARTPVA